jgi:hypothetical protein
MSVRRAGSTENFNNQPFLLSGAREIRKRSRTRLVEYLAFVFEQGPDLLQQLLMIPGAYRRDFSRHIIFDIRPIVSVQSGRLPIPLFNFV